MPLLMILWTWTLSFQVLTSNTAFFSMSSSNAPQMKHLLTAPDTKSFLQTWVYLFLSLCVSILFSFYAYPEFICAQNLRSKIFKGGTTSRLTLYHAWEKHPGNGADCTELQGPSGDPSIRGLQSISLACDPLLKQCLSYSDTLQITVK